MPLASADPFGGVIITDWYTPSETPNERMKVQVTILDRELLLDLIARAEAAGHRTQSTLQLALQAGVPVAAVPGEKHNIKLTTPMDWRIAALLEDHLQ